MSNKTKIKKSDNPDYRRFEIPSNWELRFDKARRLVWYELDGRVLFTPIYTYFISNLDGKYPRSEVADKKALELIRKCDWDLKARWDWFRTKWAALFEGGEDSAGNLVGSMGLMLRLPNGGHFHLCGRSPEDTDRDLEGIRTLLGDNGAIQPRPAITPFDDINAPLFDENSRAGYDLF